MAVPKPKDLVISALPDRKYMNFGETEKGHHVTG